MMKRLFKFVIWFIILFYLAVWAAIELHNWILLTFLDRNYDKNIDSTEISIFLFVHIGLAFLLSFKLSQRRDLRCTWCGSRKLKLVTKRTVSAGYKHANKDGSPDLRYKTNYEQYWLISKWECKKCNAVSECDHEISHSDSKYTKITAAHLSVDGSGERTATNY